MIETQLVIDGSSYQFSRAFDLIPRALLEQEKEIRIDCERNKSTEVARWPEFA